VISFRKLIPRFSLRTLVVFTLLCTSGAGLWWHWEPWGLLRVTPLEMESVTTHEGWLSNERVAMPRDCSSVVLAGDQEIFVWDTATGKQTAMARIPHLYPGTTELTKSGTVIVTASGERGEPVQQVVVWTPGQGPPRRDEAPPASDPVADSPDGKKGIRLMTPGVFLVNIKDQVIIDTPRGIRLKGQWGAFSSDGRYLVMGSSAQEPLLWLYQVGREQPVWTVSGPALHFIEAGFSRDGNTLFAVSNDFRVCVFRRRRPEWWWGVFYLWEFWLTVAFAGLFVWSVVRDGRALKVAADE